MKMIYVIKPGKVKKTSKLHEEVAKIPMTLRTAILQSDSQHTSTDLWSVTYDQLSGEKKARA